MIMKERADSNLFHFRIFFPKEKNKRGRVRGSGKITQNRSYDIKLEIKLHKTNPGSILSFPRKFLN